MACAHKDPTLADASRASSSAAQEGTASAPAPQPLMMYVGQLPQGAALFSGAPLRASPSSGRLCRSSTGSARNLAVLALTIFRVVQQGFACMSIFCTMQVQAIMDFLNFLKKTLRQDCA